MLLRPVAYRTASCTAVPLRYLYHKDVHILVGNGAADAKAVSGLAHAMMAQKSCARKARGGPRGLPVCVCVRARACVHVQRAVRVAVRAKRPPHVLRACMNPVGPARREPWFSRPQRPPLANAQLLARGPYIHLSMRMHALFIHPVLRTLCVHA